MRRCQRDLFRDALAVELLHADDRIDFFKFPGQLLAVTLGQTTGDNDALELPLFLERDQIQNSIDGFLFRLLNESARVNDYRVRASGVRKLIPLTL